MKKNWLTLDSDTFLWVKGEKGLLYNTLNGSSFDFANVGQVAAICEDLLKADNLYSVSISDHQFLDKDTILWINTVVANEMGNFTLGKTYEERPISLMPILKIQDNVQRYIWEYDREIQGGVLNNLHEVFFYINGTVSGENELYKQLAHPLKIDKCLDYHDILNFCRNSQNPYFASIYLVGSLFTYAYYRELLEGLEQLQAQLTVIVTDMDCLRDMRAYIDLGKQRNITVQVMIRNMSCIGPLFANQEGDNRHYCFLISSEAEYEYVLNTIESRNVVNYQIIPIVKDNLDFLKSILYLDEEELAGIRLSKREVFIRQSINLNDFGRLIILPNGYVYSNVNQPHLGTIKDLPIDIVYKEFLEGQSWLNVRTKKPCFDCIYQWICPSPSNIELIVGKPNLCSLKNE